MRKAISTLSIIFLMVAFSTIQAETASNLTVELQNIESGKGSKLFSSDQNFPRGEGDKQITIQAQNKAIEYTFNDINPGTYAVVAMQDMDDNGEMNTNWVGMPNEPLAVSGNPGFSFGPPSFESVSFDMSSNESKLITLSLKRL